MVDVIQQQLPFPGADPWIRRESVRSETAAEVSYVVGVHRGGYYGCSCPGWKYAGGPPAERRPCKHIEAARRRRGERGGSRGR